MFQIFLFLALEEVKRGAASKNVELFLSTEVQSSRARAGGGWKTNSRIMCFVVAVGWLCVDVCDGCVWWLCVVKCGGCVCLYVAVCGGCVVAVCGWMCVVAVCG